MTHGEQIFVDSNLSEEAAKTQNPLSVCPEEILNNQVIVPVRYWSFDNQLHQGQLVIHKSLVEDILKVFEAIEKEKFPIASVIPATDPRFEWDDDVLMDQNNTSCFNYRTIAGTTTLSYHALGCAIDINPRLNPYISKKGIVSPQSATYNPDLPGTITEGSFLVSLFDSLGWEWGGRWQDRKDWQHFQKAI
ncbi:MAG: M15 family metallopeptidase [Parcubacteria group bacterium]|nr:M15 family metallopeptidase [Parcubacteria group bacterium]